jgi:Flp pilus assembly protein TadG
MAWLAVQRAPWFQCWCIEMKSARSIRKQRGLALVELAISLTLLVTIVFGITEFGRAIFQYNTLTKSVRDAARFVAVRDPSAATAIAQTKCIAVYGNPDCSGNPLAAGLTTSMVSVCQAMDPACAATHQAQGASPVINLVSVTIGGSATPYSFTSVVPFVVPSFNFGAVSATMRQVL